MTRYSNDVKRLLERRGAMRARDGAIIDPVVDEANGVQWFFKYRKSTLGKYKWFAIGQQNPLMNVDVTARTPGTINTPLITGAALAVPLPGMYLPAITYQGNGSSVCTLLIGTYLDSTTLYDSWNVTSAAAGANVSGELLAIAGPREMTVAGRVLQVGVSTNVLGGSLLVNNLKMFPSRINI